ncbi:MAG: DUF3024 domain-containing protein [Bacteroidales bacterium]|nr:DUF3024 domain-containing protein [Bacteroidales bacterium]
MAINIFQTLDVIEALENYIYKIRPTEDMRDKYDITYKIDNQSIIIYEIREHWKNKDEKLEIPIAKTTYVKAQKHWKIFWKQSDLNWHSYKPNPIVQNIKEFVSAIENDKSGCFWG